VTGHRKSSDNIAQINWKSFIEDETIVFLMGLHNIELIVTNLLKVGKDKNYPCAIISNGTTKNQKVITGTLENIVEKSKEAVSPAIIIVGEVVNLRDELKWFDKEENI
jgi:uroporphyrin-III C-methyltransferase